MSKMRLGRYRRRAPSRATRWTAPGIQHSWCVRRHQSSQAGGVASRRTQRRRRCSNRATEAGAAAAQRRAARTTQAEGRAVRASGRSRRVHARLCAEQRARTMSRVAPSVHQWRDAARPDERRGSAGVPLTSRGDGGDRPDRTESTSIGEREVAQPRYTACGARAGPSAPNAERRVLQPRRALRARRGRRLRGACRWRGSTTAGGDRYARSA